MRFFSTQALLGWAAFVAASGLAAMASARTETLRIVTYNIEDDINAFTGANGVPRPGLIQPADSSGNYTGSTTDGGVLEGIGEQPMGASNNVQPLDILGLEETTSNTTTVAPIVNALNAYYGVPGMYAQSGVQGKQSGGNTGGNGPNAIVYNTKTLQLVASVGVGTSRGSTNGVYRQIMRYEFAPAGVAATAANEFYIYVDHYKSGTTATDQTDRGLEAAIVRADSATLPATARVLYSGDFNVTSSSEAMYQNLVAAGTNQAVDYFNPTGAAGISYSTNSLLNQKTDSSTSLSFRDDFEMMTSNVYNAVPGGLKLVPNTYHTFGSDGSTGYHGSANSANNTSLNTLVADGGTFVSSNSVKNDLTWGSDHLPVVADYALDFAGTATWTGSGSTNNWSTNTDWDLNYAPTDGDSLIFAGTTRLSNTNNTLASVGSVTFSSGAGAFTLSGNALTISGGITNNSTNQQTINQNLTMGAAQQFNAASGGMQLTGSVANGGKLLTVTGGSNVIMSGAISGTGGLTKISSGTLTVSGPNTYSGGTTVNDNGNVIVASPTALGSGGLAINNTAKVQISTGVGTVVLGTAAGGANNLKINAGSSTPTATFDVGKNSVVIPYTSSSPFATIRAQILYAADGGAWDQAGITDSSADGATFGLGYAEAGDVEGGISGGGTYVNNQSPKQSGANTVISDQAVILKYTFLGDTDLNGIVDGFDYNNLTSNLGISSGATWAQGDTNYDGTVDGFDYNNLTSNLGASGLSGVDAPVPVPEPSSWLLAAMGLAGLRWIRQSRNRGD